LARCLLDCRLCGVGQPERQRDVAGRDRERYGRALSATTTSTIFTGNLGWRCTRESCDHRDREGETRTQPFSARGGHGARSHGASSALASVRIAVEHEERGFCRRPRRTAPHAAGTGVIAA
jgi:hypothetical protein